MGKLHLWLGLTAGLVVFIISITGCIYAFKVEIEELTQSYRFVTTENKPLLAPSALKKVAENVIKDKHAHSVTYGKKGKSAEVSFFNQNPRYYWICYVNPYTGEVLKVKNMEKDFFRFILDGHFYLWLPQEIGQPVVASSTLISLFMLVSGLILWWPKNKNAAKQRFTVKWNAKWRRTNYDMHNVLGFYISWVVIFIALTGLVWGFQWFANSSYWLLSGGKKMTSYYEAVSDTTVASTIKFPEDKVWKLMNTRYPNAKSLEVHFPENKKEAIAANANPNTDTYWQTDYVYFDQNTLKEIEVKHLWGKYSKASVADKIFRMNYDIHVGAIGGLPGKCIAFFASLIAASLPITGFYIWWGRKNKKVAKSSVVVKVRTPMEV